MQPLLGYRSVIRLLRQDADKAAAARPTAVQRRILEALEAGGSLLHAAGERGATLMNPRTQRAEALQQPTFRAMQDRGWLWMPEKGVWTITTTGRKVLDLRRAAEVRKCGK